MLAYVTYVGKETIFCYRRVVCIFNLGLVTVASYYVSRHNKSNHSDIPSPTVSELAFVSGHSQPCKNNFHA